MTLPEITIRIDATWHPIVAPGDTISRGQKVCDGPDAPTSPAAGRVRTIRFDADNHQFLIAVVPAPPPVD